MRRWSRGVGRTLLGRALPLAFLVTAGAVGVDAQEVRWSGTASFSRGSYVFDASTSTFALSTGLGVTWGRLDFTGTVPLVLQNSQLVSQVAGMPLPTGGSDHGIVGRRQPGETLGTRGRGSGGAGSGTGSTQTGVVYSDEFSWTLADPLFSVTGTVYEGTGFVRSVQARGSAKPPLRELDSGVGTGEWDAGAGASAFAALGSAYVFADVGYWWYGDLPDLELVDGLSYGVGLSHPLFGARGSVMATFLGSEAVIESMERPASVGLGVSYMPRLGRSFSGGVTVGLSESSPDFSVYGGWTLTLR